MTVKVFASRSALGAGLLFCLTAGVGCGTNSNQPGIRHAQLEGYNILTVTIDTLRLDRVGAYGNQIGLTPTLDRLAREGVRFQTAYAHVPLTLPSHATIMTGRYPPSTGVRDNGTSRLDPAVPTLASTLKGAGYRTGAFVGAFVLDARFGLNHGFDTYDDRMRGSGSNLEVVQRSAEQVLAPAGAWIGQPSPDATRWFAWVHLYDPHEPYEPPPPYDARYAADPYAGEIAYADAALGAFLERLRAAGALARTLVVVAADHGESLGDHGERTHGLFAYDATIRVPLILWASGVAPSVVPDAVRLVDVMPSILDLVGVAAPAALDGRSFTTLAGAARAQPPASYFEALDASLTRNWAPLKGVVLDGLKLIDLPIPELYDLSTDPGETHNLYASQRERARPLEAALDRVAAAPAVAGTPAAMDPDAEARLRSLGYVVGTAARPPRTYTAADDPKRLVHLNTALDQGAAAWSRGDAAQAIATLRSVIGERPDLTLAYDRLAFMLRATGRIDEAVALLDSAARREFADPALLRSLGAMLRDAGKLARSAAVLEAIVAQNPNDLQAIDALGQTYARANRAQESEAMFRRVLAASPNAAATWTNLGALYLTTGRAGDAIAALTRAVAANPALATAHNALGVAYARQGDRNRAVEEWREALRIRPDFGDARANLDRVGAR